MDMSDEAINFSKENFDGKVEKGALPDQLPYQNDFFELITALDVIEHIDNDVDSISAIRSLLVPGGKCIFTVPAYMFLWSSHDEMNEHKRRYTLPELNEKLDCPVFSSPYSKDGNANLPDALIDALLAPSNSKGPHVRVVG